jgi:BRCA1-associated protein
VIYIESVEINSISLPLCSFPFLNNNEEDNLPNCPVCLEPMDTGLLTILCQHTFHCHCLSKWGDGSCPVCRYSQKPVATTATEPDDKSTAATRATTTERIIGDQNDANECAVCKSTETLWVCLICGHIGCGRYVGAHAYEHYRETSHLYSLEIETQRVWDYTGDG